MAEILYSIHQNQYFIIIKGALRYSQSGSFYDFIKKMLTDEENNKSILVDLRECSFMDSTSLGLLAKIANYTVKNNLPQAVILSDKVDINALLESVGFDSVFYITTAKDVIIGETSQIDSALIEQKKLAAVILDAHQELTMLNDKNKDVFKNVIQMFSKENNQA